MLTDLEWYLEKFENAIDGNRDERYVLASLAEDLENGGKDWETPQSILDVLLATHKIVRVNWGGDDVRYYFPEEIKFIPY